MSGGRDLAFFDQTVCETLLKQPPVRSGPGGRVQILSPTGAFNNISLILPIACETRVSFDNLFDLDHLRRRARIAPVRTKFCSFVEGHDFPFARNSGTLSRILLNANSEPAPESRLHNEASV